MLRAEYKDGTLLFPERFSIRILDSLKDEMGTPLYNAQYLNNPSSGINGFEPHWLKFYIKLPEERRSVYMGVDLAIGQEARSAYFAIVIIGITEHRKVYLEDAMRDRMTSPDQAAMIINKIMTFNPLICGIEKNGYQEAMPQWLMQDPESQLRNITRAR